MDRELFDLIEKEKRRQEETLELIPSENYVSDDVLAAAGSIATNKYAEGTPGHRYYGGCEVVDEIETLCQNRWKEVFHTDYAVNVQPHCGSTANMAAYMAVLNVGDTILSMSLEKGSHLSHGSPVSFSGKLYNVVQYDLDANDRIDMNNVRMMAATHHPKLIIAGASAYSRTIDFAAFAEIAHKYGALLMADISHIAGLIAAGLHPSPFGCADIVTTTTHKTLR